MICIYRSFTFQFMKTFFIGFDAWIISNTFCEYKNEYLLQLKMWEMGYEFYTLYGENLRWTGSSQLKSKECSCFQCLLIFKMQMAVGHTSISSIWLFLDRSKWDWANKLIRFRVQLHSHIWANSIWMDGFVVVILFNLIHIIEYFMCFMSTSIPIPQWILNFQYQRPECCGVQFFFFSTIFNRSSFCS